MSSGLCGSEPYIAPEQFLGKRMSPPSLLHSPPLKLFPFSAYDARLVDVWACGIVYYCLHFSELPWRSAQPSDTLFAAYSSACSSSAAYIASCPPTINNLNPRQCRPVLRKMLEPDPGKRLTIEQVMKETWVLKIEVCVDGVNGSVDLGHAHSCAKAMGEKNMAMLR